MLRRDKFHVAHYNRNKGVVSVVEKFGTSLTLAFPAIVYTAASDGFRNIQMRYMSKIVQGPGEIEVSAQFLTEFTRLSY